MATGEPNPTNPNPPTGSEPLPAELPPDPEGLRAWIAQVDRKLWTRTYAGAAAAILALAAAIVAIVLAVEARDNSAEKAELTRVENRVSELSEQAGAGEEAQQDVDSIDARVAELEGEVSGLSSDDADVEQRIKVIEDDIEDLRGQISDLGSDLADTAETTPPPEPADTGGTSPDDG